MEIKANLFREEDAEAIAGLADAAAAFAFSPVFRHL
jgi:hypothetical protein